jgi:tRNA threonylcarbamoyladenosine biosynthesis protein TsaE
MIKKVFELSEIHNLASEIIQNAQQKLIAFQGDLGSGKTTLIKALIQAIGIQEQGSSPSFSLINVYQNEESRVYHCDLYRLESYEEALDIGLEDYLADEESWCFIEWPEVVEFLLPKPYHLIKLSIDHNNQHYVEMDLIDS